MLYIWEKGQVCIKKHVYMYILFSKLFYRFCIKNSFKHWRTPFQLPVLGGNYSTVKYGIKKPKGTNGYRKKQKQKQITKTEQTKMDNPELYSFEVNEQANIIE